MDDMEDGNSGGMVGKDDAEAIWLRQTTRQTTHSFPAILCSFDSTDEYLVPNMQQHF